MKFFCTDCRGLQSVTTQKGIVTMETDTKRFGHLSVEWEEETAFCVNCGTDILVDEIESQNSINFKKAVKQEQIKGLGGDEQKWEAIMGENIHRFK